MFYRWGLLHRLQQRCTLKHKSSTLTRTEATYSCTAGKTCAHCCTTARYPGKSYPCQGFSCVGRQDPLGFSFHMCVTKRTKQRKGSYRSPLPYTEDNTDTRTHDASPSSWRLKAAINAMYDTTALSWKQLNCMSLDFYDQPSTYFFSSKIGKDLNFPCNPIQMAYNGLIWNIW